MLLENLKKNYNENPDLNSTFDEMLGFLKNTGFVTFFEEKIVRYPDRQLDKSCWLYHDEGLVVHIDSYDEKINNCSINMNLKLSKYNDDLNLFKFLSYKMHRLGNNDLVLSGVAKVVGQWDLINFVEHLFSFGKPTNKWINSPIFFYSRAFESEDKFNGAGSYDVIKQGDRGKVFRSSFLPNMNNIERAIFNSENGKEYDSQTKVVWDELIRSSLKAVMFKEMSEKDKKIYDSFFNFSILNKDNCYIKDILKKKTELGHNVFFALLFINSIDKQSKYLEFLEKNFSKEDLINGLNEQDISGYTPLMMCVGANRTGVQDKLILENYFEWILKIGGSELDLITNKKTLLNEIKMNSLSKNVNKYICSIKKNNIIIPSIYFEYGNSYTWDAKPIREISGWKQICDKTNGFIFSVISREDNPVSILFKDLMAEENRKLLDNTIINTELVRKKNKL